MTAQVNRHLQAELEGQPKDLRGLGTHERGELIVSLAQVDGQWVALSHFCDDKWQLTSSTSNVPRSVGMLDFTKVPHIYRDLSKEVIYRYMRRGRNGGVRPKAMTLNRQLKNFIVFFRYLERLSITRLTDVTSLTCSNFVQERRGYREGKKGGKPFSAGALSHNFLSVELLYELSQYTDDAMSSHPWPGSSATHLAGLTGVGNPRLLSAKTPMIPDEIFTTLFQHAWNLVERADVLLSIRDELHGIEVERQNQSKLNIIKVKTRYLKARGFDGGSKEFNEILLKLRTACYIVVASLSGCRNHEIAFVQSDSCYSTEDDDGVVYWWMRSQSTKTDAGHTEWMIPEAAVKALKVMDRWAKPWQAKITEEIDNRRAIAALDPEIAEARRHVGAVFLGIDTRKGSQVRTLSILGWTNALGTFAKQCGLDWHLSTHQFRRKFANYAARSRFGDLRYLREHFKHWSLDVTLAYALNESQEMALYMEIDEELNTINEGLVKGWLAPDEPLAGGYGRNIVAWRGSEAVNIFKSHKHMVRSVAESTSIRSNGHAWCTADDNLCVGNDLERTRCSGCSNAVIGKTHSDLYQGLYEHLKEILKSDDIGEAGIARVHRDMQRCSSVLKDLGYDVVGNAP